MQSDKESEKRKGGTKKTCSRQVEAKWYERELKKDEG
jgi:hypothetical protein